MKEIAIADAITSSMNVKEGIPPDLWITISISSMLLSTPSLQTAFTLIIFVPAVKFSPSFGTLILIRNLADWDGWMIRGGETGVIVRFALSTITIVTFVAVNTDVQVLEVNRADLKIQIGSKITKGLGAGGNPKIGEEAALEDRRNIQEVVNQFYQSFIRSINIF